MEVIHRGQHAPTVDTNEYPNGTSVPPKPTGDSKQTKGEDLTFGHSFNFNLSPRQSKPVDTISEFERDFPPVPAEDLEYDRLDTDSDSDSDVSVINDPISSSPQRSMHLSTEQAKAHGEKDSHENDFQSPISAGRKDRKTDHIEFTSQPMSWMNKAKGFHPLRSEASTPGSPSSIDNPRLLETVEEAIRRLILPELNALKEERLKEEQQNQQSSQESAYDGDLSTSSLGPSSRRLSMASDISSLPASESAQAPLINAALSSQLATARTPEDINTESFFTSHALNDDSDIEDFLQKASTWGSFPHSRISKSILPPRNGDLPAPALREPRDGLSNEYVKNFFIRKKVSIDEKGSVKDAFGRVVGKAAEDDEGAWWSYARRMTMTLNGDVFDADGDLIGVCEVLSETAKERTDEAGQSSTTYSDALNEAESLILEPHEFKALVTDRKDIAAECGLDVGHTVLDRSSQDSLIVSGCLGHGSLGIVEEVRRPTFKSFVRKRVQLPYRQRKRRLQIIQEEAKVLEDLCHPHIVQIIGSYEDHTYGSKQFYCLLMSPVGESDLQAFMDELGAREPTEVEIRWLMDWFPCLTSALAYMHDQGVRHQDIKPSNIVHRGSQIFFTDFSSSSRFKIGHTTSTENPARTSAMYAAPEMLDYLQDDGTLSKHGRAADIFSLGCVFSEMATIIGHKLGLRKSINEFQDFLLALPHGRRQSNASDVARVMLTYSRVTDRIALWFEQQANLNDVFKGVIAPMLRLSREERTDAHEVMYNLFQLDENVFRESKGTEYLWSPCNCHRLGGNLEKVNSG